MKITLERIDKAFHFEAINSVGTKMQLDAGPAIGGHNMGFKPMETVLAGLGGCSAIDLITILEKQREPLDDLKMTIEATRRSDMQPQIFENIHVEYHFFGNLNTIKIEKALELTFEKYCSVAVMLAKSAKVTYSYKLN